MVNVEMLKKAKKEKKMTFEQLSEKSGVPLSTLYDLFRGVTTAPRIDTMQAIERALGIRVSEGITDADRAAGATDTITVTVTSDIYEWVEIGESIKEDKGIEFFESLKKVVNEIGKKS